VTIETADGRRDQEPGAGPAPATPRPGARFSPESRADAITALGRDPFDLLVIGGGITGAGIARDAAMRGWRVALVEREDFGAGTSGRSSRLIHGGLRYLEHGHLHLVFEASRERRTLARIAPHLVRPLEFTWPVYANARIASWKLRAGLLLYDALALFRTLGRHRTLDGDAVANLEPELRQHGLRGGAVYFDAATDDARLTLANARAAAEAGTTVANHLEVRELITEAGAVRGALAVDTLTGTHRAIRAAVTINATGPWSDEVLRLADPAATPGLRGTKGAHIAVPRERLGNRGALTLLSPIDGRVMFILPSAELTMIGTTETEHTGPVDDVRATPEDITYLLRSANAFFPAAHLALSDVVTAWAGIRPLIATGANGDAGHATREHAIAADTPGLLTVRGGKLTTYRAMAAQAVDAAARSLGRTAPRRAPTDRVPLPGGDIVSVNDEIAEARPTVGSPARAEHLVRMYGSEWRAVWALVRHEPALGTPLVPGLPYLAAEAVHAVEREMAMTLADILVRRLHPAFEIRDHGLAVAPAVASLVAPALGWDTARIDTEMTRYETDVLRMFGIDGPEEWETTSLLDP
jgi:glycerol-3-phosphate dehydrogenase